MCRTPPPHLFLALPVALLLLLRCRCRWPVKLLTPARAHRQGWEETTKAVIASGRGDAIKFVVPPRAEGSEQTYVLFALDGPFELTSFSQHGRRFAIFERMRVDHMIEDGQGGEAAPAPAGGKGCYEPDPHKAAAQELASAARELLKIQREIANGLRDKAGNLLPASEQPPAETTCSPQAIHTVDQPDDSATSGAPPGAQNEEPQEQPGTSAAGDAHDPPCAEDTSGVSGSHTTIVGAGGGLLLAANMTLLLTERPGASLVVGPCYANVQEGSQAMQNGSYAIGLSEIFAIDFEAARRLDAQKAEAAAVEAAFLRELEKEEGKKSGRKSKSKKKKKKPNGELAEAAGADPGDDDEEAEPIPEDVEDLPLPEPATDDPVTSESDREDEARLEVKSPASPGGVRTPGGSPNSPGWLVVGEKKKSAESGSPVEPLDLLQEPPSPEQSSSTQHTPGSAATSEPGSAGKKSRGRRGGRRRKRSGKDGTPESASVAAVGERPQPPAIQAEHTGRVQSQQQNGWVDSYKPAAAWHGPDAGWCANTPTPTGHIRAQGIVTGPKYCDPGSALPLPDVSVHANASADPWCARGAGQHPQQQRGKAVASAVRPNWGSLNLGNGVFDPSAGFLGPSDSSPPHEPALMQSIVGALGLDDLYE